MNCLELIFSKFPFTEHHRIAEETFLFAAIPERVAVAREIYVGSYFELAYVRIVSTVCDEWTAGTEKQ